MAPHDHVHTEDENKRTAKRRPIYLVVRRDVEVHQALEEGLGDAVVGEQGVTVHRVEFTVSGQWAAWVGKRDVGCVNRRG